MTHARFAWACFRILARASWMILMSWTSAWAESFVVASSATFNSTEIPVSWLNSWRYSVSVGISPRSRETIIFRPKMMVSRDLGLIPTLTEYLHEFSQETGISVELKVADEATTKLSAHAEVQLIR